MTSLRLPVLLQALGDEVRQLKEYVRQGLLTQEEAQERLDEWELFYPPGWHRIVSLVEARRHQPLAKHERNVLPWEAPEAEPSAALVVARRRCVEALAAETAE